MPTLQSLVPLLPNADNDDDMTADDDDNDDHSLAASAPGEAFGDSEGDYAYGGGGGGDDDDDDDDDSATGDRSTDDSSATASSLSSRGAAAAPAVKAAAGTLQLSMDAGGNGGLDMNALGRDALGGWAGPEHWRLRRLAQTGQAAR